METGWHQIEILGKTIGVIVDYNTLLLAPPEDRAAMPKLSAPRRCDDLAQWVTVGGEWRLVAVRVAVIPLYAQL